MPRPEREQRMLEVAGRLFAHRGYHAVSMDEVAEQADVSKPMVYAYFGSKDGLYLAYVEQAGKELLARIRDAADPSDEPHARLHAGVLEFLRFVDERRDGWAVLYAEAAARGGPLAIQIAELRSRIAFIVKRLLQESTGTDGEAALATASLEGVAHAVVGAGESLANWWLAHPDIEAEQVTGWLMAFGRASVEEVVGRVER